MESPFADVLEANRTYAESFALRGLPSSAARGLAVVSCIDSRIPPLSMLGIKPGDAKILRNAGARVTNDVLRSLVIASHLLNVRRIMIVAHTDCAMADTTDAQMHETIRTVSGGTDTSDLVLHAVPDQRTTLESDIERLRQCGKLAAGVIVGGFIYDVDTGLIEQVVH